MITLPEEKIRELVPAGAHTAVCYLMADIGTQATKFGAKRQLRISWETADERDSAGRPFILGRLYTLSSHPQSALRTDTQGWLGRTLTATDFGKFDLSSLLGMTCTLAVVHEARGDRTYANISSVLRPPKGTPIRVSPSNPVVALSLDDRPFDYVAFEALPSWLREMIATSPEYKRAINGDGGKQARVAATTAHLAESREPEPVKRDDRDDEIPF